MMRVRLQLLLLLLTIGATHRIVSANREPVSLLRAHVFRRENGVENYGYPPEVLVYDGQETKSVSVRVRGPLLRLRDTVPTHIRLVPIDENLSNEGDAANSFLLDRSSWKTVRLLRANQQLSSDQGEGQVMAHGGEAHCLNGYRITDVDVELPLGFTHDLATTEPGRIYAVYLEWPAEAPRTEGTAGGYHLAQIPNLKFVRVPPPTHRQQRSLITRVHCFEPTLPYLAWEEEREEYCQPTLTSSDYIPDELPSLIVPTLAEEAAEAASRAADSETTTFPDDDGPLTFASPPPAAPSPRESSSPPSLRRHGDVRGRPRPPRTFGVFFTADSEEEEADGSEESNDVESLSATTARLFDLVGTFVRTVSSDSPGSLTDYFWNRGAPHENHHLRPRRFRRQDEQYSQAAELEENEMDDEFQIEPAPFSFADLFNSLTNAGNALSANDLDPYIEDELSGFPGPPVLPSYLREELAPVVRDIPSHRILNTPEPRHVGRDCPVCLDTLGVDTQVGVLQCGNDHILCAACFRECARRGQHRCPLCRNAVDYFQ